MNCPVCGLPTPYSPSEYCFYCYNTECELYGLQQHMTTVNWLEAVLDDIPDDAVCRPLNPDPMGFDAPSGKEWITWFIELVKNTEVEK